MRNMHKHLLIYRKDRLEYYRGRRRFFERNNVVFWKKMTSFNLIVAQRILFAFSISSTACRATFFGSLQKFWRRIRNTKLPSAPLPLPHSWQEKLLPSPVLHSAANEHFYKFIKHFRKSVWLGNLWGLLIHWNSLKRITITKWIVRIELNWANKSSLTESTESFKIKIIIFELWKLPNKVYYMRIRVCRRGSTIPSFSDGGKVWKNDSEAWEGKRSCHWIAALIAYVLKCFVP